MTKYPGRTHTPSALKATMTPKVHASERIYTLSKMSNKTQLTLPLLSSSSGAGR